MSTKNLTKEDLKEFFNYNIDRREHAAKFIGVSPRTIDGWKAGKPIPSEKLSRLRDFMTGMDEVRIDFPHDRLIRLERIAREKGYDSVGAFLSDVVNKLFAVALLGLVGWATFGTSPDRDSMQARLLIRGRKEGPLCDFVAEA